MILGIGSDMVDIRRIERTLGRFGEKFEQRVFTAAERAKAVSRLGAGKSSVAALYAKRFAAKEACAKALGTGLGKIQWQEIEVLNHADGMPALYLSGHALARARALCPAGTAPRLHLSLSDEYPYALAFVILSAETP